MTHMRARRREAVENDLRILRAAATVVANVGVDRLTTTGVAKEAGLTTGAMYARYQHQDELLADLWQKEAADTVADLLRTAVELRRTRAGADALHAMRHHFEDHAVDLKVALQLLVVSRRVDELADVVPGDVRAVLEELGVEVRPSTPEAAVELATVAVALGAAFLACLDGHDPSTWRTMWRWFGAEPEAGVVWPEPPPMVGVLASVPGDDVLDALVQGGQQVIARSGVERATLTRIGRAARLSPTVVYTRYANREELVVDIMEHVHRALVSAETRMRIYSSPETMAAAFGVWCQPDSVTRRRLGMEVTLASMCDPAIAAIALRHDEDARGGAAAVLTDRFGTPERAAELIALGVAMSHGASMLSEMGVDLATVDWSPFSHALCSAVRAEIAAG